MDIPQTENARTEAARGARKNGIRKARQAIPAGSI
jgi:hypothetical protein